MQHLLRNYKNGKTAFILNARAKSVGGMLLNRLIEMVPTGDLYLSHSIADSRRYIQNILEKGYENLFSGGGDGTLMNTISTVYELGARRQLLTPQIGVLRLGTGNAVASILGAKSALLDVNHVLSGGRIDSRELHMIRCDDGSLAPFAGIGLDGEVLNDYFSLRARSQGKLRDKLFKTALGYMWAGLTKTAPRHIRKKDSIVRIKSSREAIQVIQKEGKDTSIVIPSGKILFEGPASMVSVGAISCFGYGFQMFPHLKNEEFKNKMQLRVCTAGVWPIVSNLYPALWKGTYRGPHVFDFMLNQVTIESEESLPYQVAGDARGFRKEISFSLSDQSIFALELDKNRLPMRKTSMTLLPAYALAR